MKRPILPEKVHIIIDNDYDYELNITVIHNKKEFHIPYKWLVFNGLGKDIQWSWNKKYVKKINETIGRYVDGDVCVVEWNIIQDMAYLMKNSNDLGFDANAYYAQLNDKDIKYFNSTHIN